MKTIAILILTCVICSSRTAFAVVFKLPGPAATCVLTGGSSVRVEHVTSSQSFTASFPGDIELTWFERETGTSGVSTAKIAGVKDSEHSGILECLRILAAKTLAGDKSAIAFPDQGAVAFIDSHDTSSLGVEHRLASVRLANGSVVKRIEMGSLIDPGGLLLGLSVNESSVIACGIDQELNIECYVIGDTLKWRKKGTGAYSALQLGSRIQAKELLMGNKAHLRDHRETLILEASDVNSELLALKALCVIPRAKAAKGWFQHPRMYYLKR